MDFFFNIYEDNSSTLIYLVHMLLAVNLFLNIL